MSEYIDLHYQDQDAFYLSWTQMAKAYIIVSQAFNPQLFIVGD